MSAILGIPRACGTLLAILAFSALASSQYAERSALVGSGAVDVDCSGRSVKNPRVRAIHSRDPDAVGGSAYLIGRDPYLAYQLGRNINFREFRPRDGLFSDTIAGLGGPMADGTTAKITTSNQTSCLGCHNQPNGNPGGGTGFAKDSGFSRQAPHYFGAGLVEMIAIQNRQTLMRIIDTDGDLWISADEAASAPNPLLIRSTQGGPQVSYGNAALDGGATGTPQLNHIARVWYGLEDTSNGEITIVPDATGIDGVTATHYNFEIVVWGWGQRAPPSALNPTNRAFLWDPFNAHGGLQAYDPSTEKDPDGDGVSVPTVAGAVQFPATHRAPDAGNDLDELGFSRDDPDGDGHLNEISEGDLDVAEWFMLNAPRPAFAGTTAEYNRGLRAMDKFNCTSCHVANWTIYPQTAGGGDENGGLPYAGDRRLFDLDVSWNKDAGRLEGELVELYDYVDGLYLPHRDGYVVEGLFSDLAHHDMGTGFDELAYDGNVNSMWRTPPLWGVGHGFPWGHDGQSLSLDDVIRRHGGEAADSAAAYASSGKGNRKKLIAFLEKLVLYDIESLPADIDGDGEIAEDFAVAGVDTGTERFNAEWLFEIPVEIQGDVANSDGGTVKSFQAVNLDDAYGLLLDLRVDTDLDGWPDVWDHAPESPGYEDGVN